LTPKENLWFPLFRMGVTRSKILRDARTAIQTRLLVILLAYLLIPVTRHACGVTKWHASANWSILFEKACS